MPPKDLITGFYIPNCDSSFYKYYIIKPRQNIKIPIKIKREKIVAFDSKDIEENNGENDGGKEEKIMKMQIIKEMKMKMVKKITMMELKINKGMKIKMKIKENNNEDNKEQDNNEDKKDKDINEEITKDETSEIHPNENNNSD